MKSCSSDRSFRRGLASLEAGKMMEALAYFEASLRLERESPNPARKVRYASYYGFCLAAAVGRRREGLEICKRAAESEFFSPDVFLNLARVQLLMNSRKAAWENLIKGLGLDPGHQGIKAALRKMGIRRRPVLPFLDRSSSLNRAAGKLAAKIETVNGSSRSGRRGVGGKKR